MSLSAQIDSDLKDAMRAKDALKLATLRMLKSALLAEGTKPGASRELSDADAVAVIRKQIKERQSSAESFGATRPELAEKELAEAKLLEAYLPASLGEAELKAEVQKAIAESGQSGPAAMGAVMKILKERIGDKVDGKTLSAEVRAQLA